MNGHPHDILAEYVDGALPPAERAGVEAHLSECASCRGEVELAREAVAALRIVPELPAPFGVAKRAVRDVRRGRGGRLAWQLAGAAAAAAVVAVAFIALEAPNRQEQAAIEGAAGDGQAEPQPGSGDDASGPGMAAPVQTEERTLALDVGDLGYPAYRNRGAEYTSEGMAEVSVRHTREARRALEAGFPASAVAFYRDYDLGTLEPRAQRALSCVTEGGPPDRTVVPFVLEAARFEERPAYLASFLVGPAPERRYDRLQIVVVSRDTCTIRHFSRQRL